PARSTLLAGQRLVAIDVETTGFDRSLGHALIEVGTAAIDDGAVTGSWSSLVGPGRYVHPDATRVHGITEAMLVGAPAPSEVASRLVAACAGRVLVFHHAPFDLPFIQALIGDQ